MASDEETYPAVKFAYDFVQPSYGLMTARIEATVSRIQALMTFAATITLGFPVLGRAINPSISFGCAPFAVGLTFFIVLMILGVIARDVGDLKLVNPGRLYESSLHLSEWEFKRDAVFFAGESFTHNLALANHKANMGRSMSILLLAEVLMLLMWVVAC